MSDQRLDDVLLEVEVKTWLEQKVGAVRSPNVAITGTTALASANAAGNLTISGRPVPNDDPGRQPVSTGDTYTLTHNFGATPSHIAAAGLRSRLGQRVHDAGGARHRWVQRRLRVPAPLNTMTDHDTITGALTPAGNAWGFSLAGSGFQHPDDAGGNLSTAFSRVHAWR
ncbi:MAG: hypothetical protein INH41_31190 [Myxococcaceae bacterium]|jgi:hypothetical protein|nr:hypothetical protein [Myxococcaceae bacterium]MCA3016873.1 hypothetical protein [Myxococcaceae bacterium]